VPSADADEIRLMAYVAFFISFAVIGQHWAAHHAVFRWIRRLGGHVQRLTCYG
jgi:uncharacterized membrane protein